MRRGVAIDGAERMPGLPGASRRGVGSGEPRGAARIVRHQPERVVVRARQAEPGLLVLSDNWFPGWKATWTAVGRRERVDYLFRGVGLGPGRARVEFATSP